ncbi:MAG TPA: tetratricopeptide repeat protein [Nitrospirota bacterium]|nr:tetratricopeptide repeat protein [Nitrospirota bacterium]
MASHTDESTTVADSLKKIQIHLRNSRQRDAYEMLKDAMVKFYDDPMHLSFYGFLKAALDGKYRSGIEDCLRAISLFQKKLWAGDETLVSTQKAVLFLNLGKAYYASGRRKDAIDAFHKGLQSDPMNRDVQVTLQKVGIRKVVLIPFLDRSNPLNSFFGKMLRKSGNPPVLL